MLRLKNSPDLKRMAFTLFACLAVLKARYHRATEQEDTLAPPCVVAQSKVKRSKRNLFKSLFNM